MYSQSWLDATDGAQPHSDRSAWFHGVDRSQSTGGRSHRQFHGRGQPSQGRGRSPKQSQKSRVSFSDQLVPLGAPGTATTIPPQSNESIRALIAEGRSHLEVASHLLQEADREASMSAPSTATFVTPPQSNVWAVQSFPSSPFHPENVRTAKKDFVTQNLRTRNRQFAAPLENGQDLSWGVHPFVDPLPQKHHRQFSTWANSNPSSSWLSPQGKAWGAMRDSSPHTRHRQFSPQKEIAYQHPHTNTRPIRHRQFSPPREIK